MIKWLASYFSGIPAVFVDMMLYVGIAALTFIQTNLGTDDAAKYISPQVLFWLKMGIGTGAASALAMKMYRSTQYSEHLQAKKADTYPPFKPEPKAP